MTPAALAEMAGVDRAYLARRARLVLSGDKWGLDTGDLDVIQEEIEAGAPGKWTVHLLHSAGVLDPRGRDDAQRRADKREDFQTQAEAGRGLA